MKIKSVFVICIFLLATILVVACNSSEVKRIDASIEVFTFTESVNQADLIADITVIEKEGERDEPSPKTTYKVIVNNVLKGDKNLINKNISIDQQGNSEWVFNDNAFFEKEENYILILNKTVGTDVSDYWIQGEETGMYKIINDGTVVKLANSLKELNSIEDTSTSKKDFNDKVGYKDFQVLDKELLIEKIKNEVKN